MALELVRARPRVVSELMLHGWMNTVKTTMSSCPVIQEELHKSGLKMQPKALWENGTRSVGLDFGLENPLAVNLSVNNWVTQEVVSHTDVISLARLSASKPWLSKSLMKIGLNLGVIFRI